MHKYDQQHDEEGDLIEAWQRNGELIPYSTMLYNGIQCRFTDGSRKIELTDNYYSLSLAGCKLDRQLDTDQCRYHTSVLPY